MRVGLDRCRGAGVVLAQKKRLKLLGFSLCETALWIKFQTYKNLRRLTKPRRVRRKEQ